MLNSEDILIDNENGGKIGKALQIVLEMQSFMREFRLWSKYFY